MHDIILLNPTYRIDAGHAIDKFWEVQIAGTEVAVRYGRTGTNGQTNTRALPSETAAQAHADKLVQEKLDKGYREAE